MSDEVVQIPDQRTVWVWGEEIIRTEGKATYYLSLRGGINFGLKKHIRMSSSCVPFSSPLRQLPRAACRATIQHQTFDALQTKYLYLHMIFIIRSRFKTKNLLFQNSMLFNQCRRVQLQRKFFKVGQKKRENASIIEDGVTY